FRLDALAIAGLTGTPHHRRGGFFSEAGAPPGSPARNSDATLSSIQDSSCDGSERQGSIVSILSDELGSVVFSDHDEEDSDDSGSYVSEGGESFSKVSLLLKSEKEADLGGRGGARGGAREGRGGAERAGGGTGGREAGGVGADESREEGAAGTAVAGRHAPAASSARSSGGGGGVSLSAPTRVRGNEHFSRAADLSRKDEEHEQPGPTTLPLEHRRHREDRAPRPDGGTTAPASPQEEPQQRSRQRHSDGRGPEIGNSASKGSNSHIDSSGGGQHPWMRRGSASTAPTADMAAVSGADSGGGGVSPSLQTATPPRPAPTVTCKILVVGNAKCGKSSIISRFVSNRFSSDYNSTVGADYAMKDVSIPGGQQVRLQLWDIAGQDRFAKLTRAYFRRAKGAVVVCDVTREGTFDAIVRWKEEIDLWCQNEGCDLPVFLLANKSDLLTEVQDSFLAGARMEKTCRESGFAGWYITSAKRGDNIDTAMTNLLQRALEVNALGPVGDAPANECSLLAYPL
ncbi:unnamed protein product, partial [Hapterophycus canaliculatus]